MNTGIVFLVIISVVILAQLFYQAYERNRKLKEITEKLDRILKKLS